MRHRRLRRPRRPASRALHLRHGPPVVAAAQMPLEKYVEDDERVATAHLLQGELRLALLAVAPGDRDDLVLCPRTIAFSGISTVRLKWLESRG